jgi:hypothetical protein
MEKYPTVGQKVGRERGREKERLSLRGGEEKRVNLSEILPGL